VGLVLSEAYNQENKIQALNTVEAFNHLADAARFVLGTSGKTKDESAQVTDEMIGFINAQYLELHKVIEGWVDLVRT